MRDEGKRGRSKYVVEGGMRVGRKERGGKRGKGKGVNESWNE